MNLIEEDDDYDNDILLNLDNAATLLNIGAISLISPKKPLIKLA